MAELLAGIYRLQHRGQAIFVIEITKYLYLFSIVDSKILKVHSKIFSTSSLVKISRSRERFPKERKKTLHLRVCVEKMEILQKSNKMMYRYNSISLKNVCNCNKTNFLALLIEN